MRRCNPGAMWEVTEDELKAIEAWLEKCFPLRFDDGQYAPITKDNALALIAYVRELQSTNTALLESAVDIVKREAAKCVETIRNLRGTWTEPTLSRFQIDPTYGSDVAANLMEQHREKLESSIGAIAERLVGEGLIEKCAKICDEQARMWRREIEEADPHNTDPSLFNEWSLMASVAESCASRIRAQK